VSPEVAAQQPGSRAAAALQPATTRPVATAAAGYGGAEAQQQLQLLDDSEYDEAFGFEYTVEFDAAKIGDEDTGVVSHRRARRSDRVRVSRNRRACATSVACACARAATSSSPCHKPLIRPIFALPREPPPATLPILRARPLIPTAQLAIGWALQLALFAALTSIAVVLGLQLPDELAPSALLAWAIASAATFLVAEPTLIAAVALGRHVARRTRPSPPFRPSTAEQDARVAVRVADPKDADDARRLAA
jgi:hypothetical protein